MSGVGAAVVKAEQRAHVTRQEVNGGVGALYSYSCAGKGFRAESTRWHVVPRESRGDVVVVVVVVVVVSVDVVADVKSRIQERGRDWSSGSLKATPLYSMVSLQLGGAWGLWFGDSSATHA